MKAKLDTVVAELNDHQEKLMDAHGEGVLEGYTHEWLPQTISDLQTQKH